jgi:hypothetical protein
MFFALLLQIAVMLSIGVLGFVWYDQWYARAFFYGNFVAVVNSGLLVLRWRRGLKDYFCDGPRHLWLFNRSMLERFFVVTMLLAVGFGIMKLPPLGTLTGFVVGQLAWVLAMLLARRMF